MMSGFLSLSMTPVFIVVVDVIGIIEPGQSMQSSMPEVVFEKRSVWVRHELLSRGKIFCRVA
jgi:hypothetical protein